MCWDEEWEGYTVKGSCYGAPVEGRGEEEVTVSTEAEKFAGLTLGY